MSKFKGAIVTTKSGLEKTIIGMLEKAMTKGVFAARKISIASIV